MNQGLQNRIIFWDICGVVRFSVNMSFITDMNLSFFSYYQVLYLIKRHDPQILISAIKTKYNTPLFMEDGFEY